MKKPMWMAVIAASIATVLLYGLSPQVTAGAVYKRSNSQSNHTDTSGILFYYISPEDDGEEKKILAMRNWL